MAELLVELPPAGAARVEAAVRRLEGLVDGFDIPDAPLGRPAPMAAIVAARARCLTSKTILAHVRTIDHTAMGLVLVARGLRAVGVDGVVLLRGDPPALGSPLDWDTVEAARLVREHARGIMVGGLVSLRYPLEKVRARLASGVFDVALVLRATEAPDRVLEEVSREARRRGVRLYGYVIVGGDSVEPGLEGQPVLGLEEAAREAERLAAYLDGVLVSRPGGLDGLVEAVRAVRSRLGG